MPTRGDSNSITNQRTSYSDTQKEHRSRINIFVDDGYSGTNYDRPGFQQMLSEIEGGESGCCCCRKTLSRLGAKFLVDGLCISTSFFPKYGVRYIAINDHFDTIH